MDNWERTLRDEFDAADGSFLSQLRCQLHWDKIAFARLVSAMECCAKAHEGRGTVERWMANGFWYFCWFVPEWSGHPDFPLPEADYHRKACARIFDLSTWFFSGVHPLEGSESFEPL